VTATRHPIITFTVLACLTCLPAFAQEVRGNGPSVSLVSAPDVTVTRGKAGTVPLGFRIARGFHVNSNTPRSEYLIPTELKLEAVTDIVVSGVKYPAGQDLAFDFAPGEKLSVYSGDFTLGVSVRPLKSVVPGKYRLRGTLRYQACDNRACYPPKKLPVEFEVKVAKNPPPPRRRSAQSPHIHN
jgi:cytochrome c biogenesis DsbD-like protein